MEIFYGGIDCGRDEQNKTKLTKDLRGEKGNWKKNKKIKKNKKVSKMERITIKIGHLYLCIYLGCAMKKPTSFQRVRTIPI